MAKTLGRSSHNHPWALHGLKRRNNTDRRQWRKVLVALKRRQRRREKREIEQEWLTY